MQATFNEDWYPSPQLKRLVELAAENIQFNRDKEGDVIEIGCREGKSTHALANAVYPEKLLCVDTWKGNVEEGAITGIEHPTVTILRNRDVLGIFKNNMKNLTQGNYETIQMDSFEFLRNQYGTSNRKIKFCHIDASHDYPHVLKTLQLILPHLIPGGLLCGDDYQNSHKHREDLQGGIERAVTEMFLIIPHMAIFGIGKVLLNRWQKIYFIFLFEIFHCKINLMCVETIMKN